MKKTTATIIVLMAAILLGTITLLLLTLKSGDPLGGASGPTTNWSELSDGFTGTDTPVTLEVAEFMKISMKMHRTGEVLPYLEMLFNRTHRLERLEVGDKLSDYEYNMLTAALYTDAMVWGKLSAENPHAAAELALPHEDYLAAIAAPLDARGEREALERKKADNISPAERDGVEPNALSKDLWALDKLYLEYLREKDWKVWRQIGHAQSVALDSLRANYDTETKQVYSEAIAMTTGYHVIGNAGKAQKLLKETGHDERIHSSYYTGAKDLANLVHLMETTKPKNSRESNTSAADGLISRITK